MDPGHPAQEQSLPELTFFLSWLSLQDRFLFAAVFLRVEQHEVAARGAFDPDGEGQMIIVILPEGEIVTPEGRAAIEPERGKAPDAERVCRAADGTSSQAEPLKCLRDFGDESLTPSHAPLHLSPDDLEPGDDTPRPGIHDADYAGGFGGHRALATGTARSERSLLANVAGGLEGHW